MTIIEAVRSGKPFRRPEDAKFYGPDFWVELGVLAIPETDGLLSLNREDILADDWEVKTDDPGSKRTP